MVGARSGTTAAVQHDESGVHGGGLSGGPGAAATEPDIRVVEPLCAVFRRTLKAEGLKYTPERAQVLETVMRLEGVFEAEKILAELRTSGVRVSKATVYRTIKLLQDAGIIQRVLFDDSEDSAYYQLVYGQRPDAVIVRVDTGEVRTIEVPELIAIRDRVCRELGLSPAGHRLQIFASG